MLNFSMINFIKKNWYVIILAILALLWVKDRMESTVSYNANKGVKSGVYSENSMGGWADTL